jgi:ABC-type polar amino acid transport system ATPase subunit
MDVQPTQSNIEVRGLKKSYLGRLVLRGIDLDVGARQLTVLIGASGCGKTTLLHCLNGLEVFDEGCIRLDGITLESPASKRADDHARLCHQLRARVGMVFQSFDLFPHMTALENVARPPIITKRMPRKEAYDQARDLLAKVGLGDHHDHYPRQLTGGQQQRAAIARALAMRPVVMLYDEPTSALDPERSGEVLQVMRDLAADGTTQLVVSHEMHFARDAADKVVFLAEGRVIEEGAPEQIFKDPGDPRTRQFLKRYL